MKNLSLILFLATMLSCENKNENFSAKIYETSASGHQMAELDAFPKSDHQVLIKLNSEKTYQTITGIGGSFTESSAHLLNQLSKKNRTEIMQAYFGDEGARYSLTRTHMNSCDFSISNYSYAPTPDKNLSDFSIEEDRNDIIPMIKEAMAISSEGFKIISSPWTAPPWMKDNNNYVGGKLLPEYYDSWALFFSKYLDAYKKEGIDIWGVTVENEPLGNGNNWESMHYTAEEMTEFVKVNLGPKLEMDGWADIQILGYDQNRDHLKEWVDIMYQDEASAKYIDGTAIHWYASTYEVFPEVLQYAHKKAPDKYLIETEGCIDAQIPVWRDDPWYWKKEATDWGWDWAPDEEKHLHPKYSPANRYARDIIGCLNNWVDGWVDWNMVLDRQGGPNWKKNWCIAPVIVDIESDEVYYTPLYYIMTHFSKFIRPNAKRIGIEINDKDLVATAVKNPDGTLVIQIFNEGDSAQGIKLSMDNWSKEFSISAQAIQTVVVTNKSQ